MKDTCFLQTVPKLPWFRRQCWLTKPLDPGSNQKLDIFNKKKHNKIFLSVAGSIFPAVNRHENLLKLLLGIMF